MRRIDGERTAAYPGAVRDTIRLCARDRKRCSRRSVGAGGDGSPDHLPQPKRDIPFSISTLAIMNPDPGDSPSPSPPMPGTAEELLPLENEVRRRLASVRMARQFPGQTLLATALVHRFETTGMGAEPRRFSRVKITAAPGRRPTGPPSATGLRNRGNVDLCYQRPRSETNILTTASKSTRSPSFDTTPSATAGA